MILKNIRRKHFLFILLLILCKETFCQNSGLDKFLVTPGIVKVRLDNSLVKNIHPRLFFSKEDITKLIHLNKNGDSLIRIGYKQNLRDAEEVLKQPLLKYFLDDAKLRVPSVHKFAVQLPPLIMMYQLTGDTNYARRVINQFIQLSNFPDWGANRHFLDAGIGAFDFALAYDALYSFMNKDEKNDERCSNETGFNTG